MSKINFKKYSVKKSEKMTEQRAIEKAMKAMDTFEGNLQSDHTDTHYKFSKIRG